MCYEIGFVFETGSHCEDQVDLELTDVHLSLLGFPSAGIKHYAWPFIITIVSNIVKLLLCGGWGVCALVPWHVCGGLGQFSEVCFSLLLYRFWGLTSGYL